MNINVFVKAEDLFHLLIKSNRKYAIRGILPPKNKANLRTRSTLNISTNKDKSKNVLLTNKITLDQPPNQAENNKR